MTRRNPPAKWVLPDTINPEDRLCVTIQVPNDFQHRAAFWGALQDLGSAAKWADDPLHKAREVAQVWREIINETIIGDCLMPIIFRDVDCDIIEFSTDDGETWEVLVNLSECFISRHPYAPARNEITPTGNYSNLILTPFPGQTEPLLGTGVLNIYPVQGVATYALITGYSFVWTLGGAQAFSMLYGQEIGLALHPAMRQFISGQKASIGGYSGMPEIVNMLEVNVSSNTLRGFMVKAASGQTYPLAEFRQADGTLLSGTDEIGRQFLRTVGAVPTDNTAKNGTIVANVVDITLDVKMGSGWVQFQQQGPQGEPGETGETGPQGETGETGPQGMQGPSGIINSLGRPIPGASEDVTLLVGASEWAMLPWTLEQGDYLTLLDTVGWVTWQDDLSILQGYTGMGTYYHTGATAPDAGSSFILSDEPLMSILCRVNARASGLDHYDYYGIAALVASAEITEVDATAPYAVIECNRPDTPIAGELHGHLLVTVRLLATLGIVECGESDFALGMLGWHLKGASEEPCVPTGGTPPCAADGAWLGDGFGPTNKHIIIIGYIGSVVSAPSVTINYTVTADGQQLYVIFGRRRAGGSWDTGGYQYIDTSIGTHDHTNGGDLGDYDALMVQIGPAGPEYGPISYRLNSVTINCD